VYFVGSCCGVKCVVWCFGLICDIEFFFFFFFFFFSFVLFCFEFLMLFIIYRHGGYLWVLFMNKPLAICIVAVI